jgi:hypothetical protein
VVTVAATVVATVRSLVVLPRPGRFGAFPVCFFRGAEEEWRPKRGREGDCGAEARVRYTDMWGPPLADQRVRYRM